MVSGFVWEDLEMMFMDAHAHCSSSVASVSSIMFAFQRMCVGCVTVCVLVVSFSERAHAADIQQKPDMK